MIASNATDNSLQMESRDARIGGRFAQAVDPETRRETPQLLNGILL